MKIRYDFTVREIAGECILVPMGAGALEFSGMMTTNDVGAFMVEKLGQDISKEELVQAVIDEFEIDKATVMVDVEDFLEQLKRMNLLMD